MPNTLIAQLNNPAVVAQVNQRMATAISIVLIVACAYVLVEVTWLFFPAEDETAVLPLRGKAEAERSKRAQQENFNKLTAANIFGVSEKAVSQKPSKAPETRLNLTLKGVLAATPMERASAIIAQGKQGKEDIYSVGDKMRGGVVIREIHPEYVVLERSGRLETLKLQKISGVAGFKSSNSSSYGGRSRAGGSQASTLSGIRKNILKNPASFGEYALPVVVKENGKQVGYRLQPQAKGEMLSELGIQGSDVITQINGVKLDNPQNGISALRKLSTAKSFNIVVKRNGAEVPLNITLQ